MKEKFLLLNYGKNLNIRVGSNKSNNNIFNFFRNISYMMLLFFGFYFNHQYCNGAFFFDLILFILFLIVFFLWHLDVKKISIEINSKEELFSKINDFIENNTK